MPNNHISYGCSNVERTGILEESVITSHSRLIQYCFHFFWQSWCRKNIVFLNSHSNDILFLFSQSSHLRPLNINLVVTIHYLTYRGVGHVLWEIVVMFCLDWACGSIIIICGEMVLLVHRPNIPIRDLLIKIPGH